MYIFSERFRIFFTEPHQQLKTQTCPSIFGIGPVKIGQKLLTNGSKESSTTLHRRCSIRLLINSTDSVHYRSNEKRSDKASDIQWFGPLFKSFQQILTGRCLCGKVCLLQRRKVLIKSDFPRNLRKTMKIPPASPPHTNKLAGNIIRSLLHYLVCGSFSKKCGQLCSYFAICLSLNEW